LASLHTFWSHRIFSFPFLKHFMFLSTGLHGN
jgi:hypothetical protein